MSGFGTLPGKGVRFATAEIAGGTREALLFFKDQPGVAEALAAAERHGDKIRTAFVDGFVASYLGMDRRLAQRPASVSVVADDKFPVAHADAGTPVAPKSVQVSSAAQPIGYRFV